ncbi:MAG: hypothetical protein KKE77_12780 [Alphaproteobacteria bacterium]|nr:hypothetical protein [Alphaproteobacteria bacterium]
MRRLSHRIGALEAVRGITDYSHLSDADLKARLVAVCEGIEALGGPSVPDWRRLIEREDYGPLIAEPLA